MCCSSNRTHVSTLLMLRATRWCFFRFPLRIYRVDVLKRLRKVKRFQMIRRVIIMSLECARIHEAVALIIWMRVREHQRQKIEAWEFKVSSFLGRCWKEIARLLGRSCFQAWGHFQRASSRCCASDFVAWRQAKSKLLAVREAETRVANIYDNLPSEKKRNKSKIIYNIYPNHFNKSTRGLSSNKHILKRSFSKLKYMQNQSADAFSMKSKSILFSKKANRKSILVSGQCKGSTWAASPHWIAFIE